MLIAWHASHARISARLGKGVFHPRCIPKAKGAFVLPVEPMTGGFAFRTLATTGAFVPLGTQTGESSPATSRTFHACT